MKLLAALVAALLAAMTGWLGAEAAEARITDFAFSCETPEGRKLKPKLGDVGGVFYTDLPAQRQQCLEAVKRKIALCRENTDFASNTKNEKYAECLPIFREQAQACVGHFEREQVKCDGGGAESTAIVAVAHNPTPPFSAGVLTPPALRVGEQIEFALTTDTTGYGHLYLLNASAGVLVLVENLPVAAGVQATFPPPGGTFKLRVMPPAGTERVLFLVTRERFAGFSDGGPVQLSLGAPEFVMELNAATSRLVSNGWALAEARLEVLPAAD